MSSAGTDLGVNRKADFTFAIPRLVSLEHKMDDAGLAPIYAKLPP